ncbi:MAG: DUF4173 domain-containing protein [Acidobacteria bacterium]|nr:DUF4173 domain-containing protein [Acidobacteriota bacterium]MBV9476186.1 DUF4173 domain-containing protein [Acidobacteriota bacterium]
MNRHRAALTAALLALLLGLAADLLLRYIPWGLNAFLWTLLAVVAAATVARRRERAEGAPPLQLAFPAACALVASACLVWRDSPRLEALDIFMLLIFLPMLAAGARGVRLANAGLTELAGSSVTTGLQAAAGFPQLVLSDLTWQAPRGGTLRTGGVVFRGVVIALPALLLFGALLASADAAFAKLISDLITFDLKAAIQHLVVTAIVAAICAGFLRSLLFSGAMPRVSRPDFLALGAAETNIAIGLINLLFATFVGVQFRYFFGGAHLVRVGNLTWSEYARRGFFELVWVVTLTLPMLLAAEWLIRKDDARGLRTFRILAVVQIALVFIIAVSAYQRMQLYRDAYGLTEDRFYTTAFMCWLGALLVWFIATVLTGHRGRFAIGVLASGVLAVVTLHAINPDALIVRTNLARTQRPFDDKYVVTLSDDAAEVILSNPSRFAPETLAKYEQRPRPFGWRTWNASRARALELLRR